MRLVAYTYLYESSYPSDKAKYAVFICHFTFAFFD